MLQVPELQRAMGFTKDYKLNQGSRRDRIKLLGNGVCPPVMEKIVAALTGIRAETDAEHQDAVILSKIEIPLAAVA